MDHGERSAECNHHRYLIVVGFLSFLIDDNKDYLFFGIPCTVRKYAQRQIPDARDTDQFVPILYDASNIAHLIVVAMIEFCIIFYHGLCFSNVVYCYCYYLYLFILCLFGSAIFERF